MRTKEKSDFKQNDFLLFYRFNLVLTNSFELSFYLWLVNLDGKAKKLQIAVHSLLHTIQPRALKLSINDQF